VEKTKTSAQRDAEEAIKALEADLGEPVLYRATGRFLAAQGLGPVPLDSWGLLVLTPSRLSFRHFSQAHPLFGGRDAEARLEVGRGRFAACEARLQPLWTKLLSGTPEHLSLSGPGVRLDFELADDLGKFLAAWNTPAASS